MDLMKNEKVNNYINLVCSRIKFQDIHGNIRVELLDHLDCIIEEYQEKGKTSEEAIELGLKQMGDPNIVGKKLNKVHKPKPEWSILILTSIFTLIGILAIYTMNFYGLEVVLGDRRMIIKSILTFVVGIGVVAGLYFFDYRKIKSLSKYLYIGTSILVILGNSLTNFGVFNTCKGNIVVFGTSFTYLVPFLYAIALSGIFSEDRWEKDKIILNLGILILPIVLILVFQSSTVAPIIMYISMILVLMFSSGSDIKYILGLVGSGIVVLTFFVFNEPYRVRRFKSFLNPLQDPLGNGFMDIQLRKLIFSAGLFGNRANMANSETSILNIAEMSTDYIFSYIVHAFGWIAGISIIVLSFVFFIRLIKAIKDIEDSYGKLLVATFSSLFIVQFVYNILMVLGLVPVAGISLPFISYGTTLDMVNMIMIGIISSVYRRKDVSEEVVV